MSSAADQARAAINLRTLQRIDKSIQSILDWAGYVVLYLHADGKWTKEGVEGSMFLYERDSAPHYGLLILNRNGKQNYIQAISPATEVEVQDRMINLDEGANGEQTGIVGLWCSKGPEEAQQMATRIRSLAQQAKSRSDPRTAELPLAQTQDPTLTMSDLMSRLSAGHGSDPQQKDQKQESQRKGADSTPTATMPTPDLASGNSASTSTMMLKQMLGLSSSAAAKSGENGAKPSSSPESSPRNAAAKTSGNGRSVFDSPQTASKGPSKRRKELVKAMDDSDEVSVADSTTPRRSTPRRAAASKASGQQHQKQGKAAIVEDSTTQDEADTGGDGEDSEMATAPAASHLRTPALKTARQHKGKTPKATRRDLIDSEGGASSSAATPVKASKKSAKEKGSRRSDTEKEKGTASAVPIRLADRGYIPSPTRNGDLSNALEPTKLKAAILGGLPATKGSDSGARSRKTLVEDDRDDAEQQQRTVDEDTEDEPVLSSKSSRRLKVKGNQDLATDSSDAKDAMATEREEKREFVKALLHQIHTNQAFVDDLWEAYRST